MVSQAPDNAEPIVAPKRPKYTASRGLRWLDVPESDVSLSPEGSYVQQRVTKELKSLNASRRPPDPSPSPESDEDSDSSTGPQETRSDVGIPFSKSGRRYTEWTGTFMFYFSQPCDLTDGDFDQMPKQATRWQIRHLLCPTTTRCATSTLPVRGFVQSGHAGCCANHSRAWETTSMYVGNRWTSFRFSLVPHTDMSVT